MLEMAPTLDCDDCRNYWLIQYMKAEKYYLRNYFDHSEFLCSNQKKLTDTSNFKKCVN